MKKQILALGLLFSSIVTFGAVQVDGLITINDWSSTISGLCEDGETTTFTKDNYVFEVVCNPTEDSVQLIAQIFEVSEDGTRKLVMQPVMEVNWNEPAYLTVGESDMPLLVLQVTVTKVDDKVAVEVAG